MAGDSTGSGGAGREGGRREGHGDDRVHRTVVTDGTGIAGRVHGEGPPLVLVHGGISDGEMNWLSLLPLLSDHFTCYLVSTRGRGLSGDHPDHSPERLMSDVAEFVESIGEPVGLVGHSSGGAVALGAASRTDAVSAVAVYEPALLAAAGDRDVSRIKDAFARMAKAAAGNDLAGAARVFFELVATDEELPRLLEPDYIEPRKRYVPVLLQEVRQAVETKGSTPGDPSVLAKVTAPVLLLHGSRSGTWFKDSVRYLREHVGNLHVRELAGVGHFGPVTAPEAVADEIARFFGSVGAK